VAAVASAASEGGAGAGAEGGGDVYMAPQPLEEGVRKHTISIFVADESGIINRIAGVFSRRGANIESLAVGLNIDKAVFTVVVAGDDSSISNLCKQISKLVKVRVVEDITNDTRVDRELLLVKVAAGPGERTEVMQLAEVFRGRVVDTADNETTVCVSGDPGKTYAFEKAMSKFGVVAVARTGKIALQRGAGVLSPTEQLPLEKTSQSVSATTQQRATTAAEAGQQVDEDDVYGSSTYSTKVWDVNYLLDSRSMGIEADQMPAADDGKPHRRTLSLLVNDVPGVLGQVTGVFARRGYNLQSLAVGSAEKPGLSRITLVVPGTSDSIEKLKKQVLRLIEVEEVTDVTNVPHITRELMLMKVKCSPKTRSEILDIARIFRASIVDAGPHSVIIEAQGREGKMVAMQDVLRPYGIVEVARTGRIVLTRGFGVDTSFLDANQVQKLF